MLTASSVAGRAKDISETIGARAEASYHMPPSRRRQW